MIITCVHQGYELYGSDRSFVEAVTVMRACYPEAEIDIVLPRHGPIVAELEPFASTISIEPLWVLRRKDLPRLATIGLLKLPFAVRRAYARLRRSDILYINTSVVVDYIIASRLRPRRSFIHLHEITTGMTRRLLRVLVGFSGANVIFNSHATRKAFALPSHQPSRVVYNGLAGPSDIEPTTFDGKRPLRLLMLGRYSRIKGQEVLIEALSMLPPDMRPETRIVGSAFEDDGRAENLAALITLGGMDDKVTLMPFAADPAPHYIWADVVTVPSRLPESLGRVAIEAMAYGRPPLASSIGGLPEVVDDGWTGWLVEPDSATALCDALRMIIENPSSWSGFPAAGRARYEALFSEAAFERVMTGVLAEVLGGSDLKRSAANQSSLVPGEPA